MNAETADPLAPPRERILILLEGAENRRLLAEALSGGFAVTDDVRDPDVDLCIVDGVSLRRHWDRLRAMRSSAEPLLLPVLLATARRDVGFLTAELWRVVDDIIFRPIEKAELRVRLDTLLRGRRLSLQLRRMAGMYEHERHVALRLQSAGLPRGFPVVPGVRFDAFYRPGSDEALIGGDWYDVMRIADGRVVLTVGDVGGAGLDAAVTMASIRHVVRGVAQVHADPALMLGAADRTLAAESGTDQQVTAFVGVFDPITSFFTFASAGHPPAMLRGPSGIVRDLTTGDLPLGVMANPARRVESIEVEPGSLLVVYTDGLTEAARDVERGERRVIAAVGSSAVAEAADAAFAVVDAVLDTEPSDDVAVLAMRTDPVVDRSLRRWSLDACDAAAARTVRDSIRAVLAAAGFDDAGLTTCEVVFAELIGNVARHAPGSVDIVLDASGTEPVLHVLDRGPGFRLAPRLPYEDLSERGRGLFIVNELARQFHVLHRHGGGSHATAVLRGARSGW